MNALFLALVLGCGDKKAPRTLADPVELAAQAWERRVPFALKAGYSVSIDAPRLGISGTTRGGLVVHRPGKFRLEIYSPLGSPLVYAASDGKQVGIYVVTEQLWLGSDDAEGLLRSVTGGSAGIEDLVSLMIGRMPFSDAEILDRKVSEGLATYTFGGPEDTKANVALDVKTLTNHRIEAFDPEGARVLEADYEDYQKVGRSLLPEEVVINAESIQFQLELEFDSWDELGVIPDAFDVPAPKGSRVVDLDEMLEKARLARELGLQPQGLDELMAVEAPEPEPEPEPEPIVTPEAPEPGSVAPDDGVDDPELPPEDALP